MKKMINTENIQGRIYQHDLAVKTVQNKESENYKKPFISGTLHVAVDEEGLNVIPVHYTYVTENTKNGNKNRTFTALNKIITEGKTWIESGKEEATKVKIDTALALNDFPDQSGEMVSVKRNEGGFVTIVDSICDEGINRHKFTTDMFITSTKRVEPQENDDENVKDYLVLKGAVFNFRNDILPVDFVVRNPQGISYFENLDISPKNPVFTKVWGRINSITVRKKKEEVSAFGEAAVSYIEKKTKEWTVTGVSPEPYAYGSADTLTNEEVIEAMQNREVMLAEKKRQKEEWEANKNTSGSSAFNDGAMNTPNSSTVNYSGFDF